MGTFPRVKLRLNVVGRKTRGKFRASYVYTAIGLAFASGWPKRKRLSFDWMKHVTSLTLQGINLEITDLMRSFVERHSN